MTIEISPETESRLSAKAREEGVSVDALIVRLLGEAGDLTPQTTSGDVPKLPIRYLGVIGSLHRRDIYDDVC
jgi:hypothetical protein